MKYMMVVLLAGLSLALFFLPLTEAGERGAYNVWSGLAWCENYSACLHEVAHALDKEAGWISQTPAFADALQMYFLTDAGNDDKVILLLAVALQPPDGRKPTKKELYAWLFELSNGEKMNMPVGLRDFYDWRLAERFVSMIDGGGLYLWRR